MPHAKIDYIITWTHIDTKFSLQGAINGDDAKVEAASAAIAKKQQNPMQKEVPRPKQ